MSKILAASAQSANFPTVHGKPDNSYTLSLVKPAAAALSIQNGDFSIATPYGEPAVNVTGNAHNEETKWKLDFSGESWQTVASITSANLILTTVPGYASGGTNDAVRIGDPANPTVFDQTFPTGGFVGDISFGRWTPTNTNTLFTRKFAKGGLIAPPAYASIYTVGLLDMMTVGTNASPGVIAPGTPYTSQNILNVLRNNNGLLPMVYSAYAVVVFAQLNLEYEVTT